MKPAIERDFQFSDRTLQDKLGQSHLQQNTNKHGFLQNQKDPINVTTVTAGIMMCRPRRF